MGLNFAYVETKMWKYFGQTGDDGIKWKMGWNPVFAIQMGMKGKYTLYENIIGV